MKKILVAAVALGLSWGMGAAFGAEEAPTPEGPKYGKNVGEVAKPVTIKSLDGATDFNTGALKNKSMFVFVNSVCGICARELMDLDKVADKLKGVDLYLVAIDVQKDRAVEKFKQYEGKFKLLHDPDFAFGQQVDFYSTPATLVLEKDGKILGKTSGYYPEGLKQIVEAAKASN